MLKSTEIKKDVYWVGALDPNLRIFDIIMYTPYGTTYNSYVVKGTEKIAVFETVKEQFFDEYVERLKDRGIDIKDIDYVVINHTEPDHSGSIAKLYEINPEITVVGTRCALNFARQVSNVNFKSIEAKDGDTLDLGGKTVRFIHAPFLHWPDTMYSYVEEDKALITCDSFGSHYSFDGVFDDLIPSDKEANYQEALRYYFDMIFGPYKKHMVKAIDKIADLDIELALPGHGPVLRKDPRATIAKIREWSLENPLAKKRQVSINYVSAYGYTREIAETIAEGIKSVADIDVKLNNIIEHEMGDLVAEIGASDAVLFGSPTIVGELLEPVRVLMAHLNPIVHGGKISGAFGSYGWSGEAVPRIETRLAELKFKTPAKSLKVNFRMNEEDKKTAFEYGKTIANAIPER